MRIKMKVLNSGIFIDSIRLLGACPLSKQTAWNVAKFKHRVEQELQLYSKLGQEICDKAQSATGVAIVDAQKNMKKELAELGEVECEIETFSLNLDELPASFSPDTLAGLIGILI